MGKYNRIIELGLTSGQSAFLLGARNTGKSSFLAKRYPDAICYDLLNTDTLHRLRLRPALLREELKAITKKQRATPIIIDEIQKVPELLDEVHWLIENAGLSFILCGSSARKLVRGSANMLGGRAWKFTFYPLVFPEINDFDLLKALTHGLLPAIYTHTQAKRSLKAYIDLYLKEEIQVEGLVRNLVGFSRFLDLVGFCNGERINYKKISTDCGVDAKTVKAYFQILLDTLIGYYLYPFTQTKKRQLISATPKFYLFDVGIANYLSRSHLTELKGAAAGKAFEHYIFMELTAYIGIKELDINIHYWQSKTGLEVDFVLNNGEVAIEVKISQNPRPTDYKGLLVFCEDYQPKKAIVVCLAPTARITDKDINIQPWRHFLTELWAGNIINN